MTFKKQIKIKIQDLHSLIKIMENPIANTQVTTLSTCLIYNKIKEFKNCNQR
ncbi:hypothetical protein Hanom_Chr06g00491501 [Helianthus anomalus]